MTERLAPWLLYCYECKLWTSRLGNKNSKLKQSTVIIEENRNLGLKYLRLQNFQRLLNTLEAYMTLDGSTACDVGSSYGWFVEAAAMRGMKVIGIEPEESVALVGINRGLDISVGYFPDCMNASDKFDVITFNDSLEHLSNIGQVLESCYRLLMPSGKLVINIPTSQGFFFKLGLFLYRFGYKAPFHRLWQKGYSSPHIFYFNSKNLERCVSQYKFRLLCTQPLKTVSLSGLWKRLTMDKNSSVIYVLTLYVLLVLLYPFLQLFTSDALLQIYEKQD
ncbi:MAG TPA: class I SAM-dependent methyltransferase [Coleofasciculaceae cyanobacterium]|jgi:SAM-dependent methyltransferase